jgi:hypothetical protein
VERFVSLAVKQRVGRWLFRHLPFPRCLFDQLDFEANAWSVGAQNAVLPGRRARPRELHAMLY